MDKSWKGNSLKKIFQMTNKYMKRCTTSLVISESLIKATIWYHYTPTTISKMRMTDNNKCWQRFRATRTLIYCRWECKLVWSLLLPNDRMIPLLGIYLRRIHTYMYQKACIRMFTEALVIITQIWKLWTVHQYYSVTFTQRNVI